MNDKEDAKPHTIIVTQTSFSSSSPQPFTQAWQDPKHLSLDMNPPLEFPQSNLGKT